MWGPRSDRRPGRRGRWRKGADPAARSAPPASPGTRGASFDAMLAKQRAVRERLETDSGEPTVLRSGTPRDPGEPYTTVTAVGGAALDPESAASDRPPSAARQHPPLRAPGTLPPLPREKSDSPLAGLSPLDLLAIAVGQRDMDDETRLRREAEQLARIRVVGFIGPSGTGKSTRAVTIARESHIDYFIDDGLLIYGSRIVAGTSAKRAATRMESVRQALFNNEARAATMRRALAEQAPDQLMILGTSDGMLERIIANLHLNSPTRIIRIEDVTTEEERRTAQAVRLTQGQHTIPVPSMEIKHEFSGLWAEPLSRLRSRLGSRSGASTEIVSDDARTVVRPTFSTLGAYSISDEAIRSMIRLATDPIEGLSHMTQIDLRKESYGVVVDAELALYYGYEAQRVMQQVQHSVKQTIESLTSMNVLLVNVSARKVVHRTQSPAPAVPVGAYEESL